MNRIKKALVVAVASTALGGAIVTGAGPAPAPQKAEAASYVTHLTANSNRTIRVYREKNCVGYKNQLLKPTHRNADYPVRSVKIKPYREVQFNWVVKIQTDEEGRCYNIPPIGMLTLALEVKTIA